MELDFWANTDVGRVRDHNEDNFLVDKKLNLFVVCDGMGGHAAGEVASAISVRVVREVIAEHRELIDRLSEDPDDPKVRGEVLNLMERALQEACSRVWKTAQEDESKRGMGTTCSALLLAEGHGFIGHVGDSRIYLYRQDQVIQLTEDHSLANEMIRLGKIKRGEEHNLPHRNAVTRAVGVNESVEVDTFQLDLFGGDSLLMCSDGLSGYFKTDDQIVDLMELDDPKDVTLQSIDFANEGGGKDNITAISIYVRGGDIAAHELQSMVDVISAAPYFQYLSYKEVVRILNLSRREEFEAGEKIFAEREDPGRLFLVLQGSVRLSQGEQVIKLVAAGDNFGEMAVIDERPQPYAASASEPTILLTVARDAIMDMMRLNPKLAVKLLWNFVQTFAIRFQQVPIDFWLRSGMEAPAEPTPPRGVIVADQTVETDISKFSATDRQAKTPAAVSEPAPSRSVETVQTASAPEIASKPKASDTQEDGNAIDWGSDEEPLFGEDAAFLRETVDDVLNHISETMSDPEVGDPDATQVPFGNDPEATQVPFGTDPDRTLANDFSESENTVAEHAPLGKPISGESIVPDSKPPKAQVLRRTKTGEAKSVPKREPTLEIDLADDNVEEIS